MIPGRDALRQPLAEWIVSSVSNCEEKGQLTLYQQYSVVKFVALPKWAIIQVCFVWKCRDAVPDAPRARSPLSAEEMDVSTRLGPSV